MNIMLEIVVLVFWAISTIALFTTGNLYVVLVAWAAPVGMVVGYSMATIKNVYTTKEK